jgi:hypothetical protein
LSQDRHCWEFTAHLFRDGTRWSWTIMDGDGNKLEESRLTFGSFADAMSNARGFGFHAGGRFVLAAIDSHLAPRRHSISYGPALGWPQGLAIV